MSLQIYNSLTRCKQLLVPLVPNQVRMYVCGMTVYDYCHLGHARVLVVFDTVYRYLRHLGYDVIYVRNITDIDDKIIQRAHASNISVTELTTRFIHEMHTDAVALNVLPPTIEPCATAHIAEIVAMIEQLIAHGHAYCAANGDVYYAVDSFPTYGQLSGKALTDLRAGARVEIDVNKRDPLDFVLWKAAKPNEPAWESPWGLGRPGWHIECSAMSTHCLGHQFDIHGGGADLQFPHHENEIAQSEGATGERFVNIWMHNGFVRINEEKMSKSLGNFFTVRDVLTRYRAEEVRYFILTSQYRSPLNYADEQLDNARAALTRLYTTLREVPPAPIAAGGEHYRAQFHAAMDDDFNTPEALAVLFELTREINRAHASDIELARGLAAELQSLASVLGLLQHDAAEYLQGQINSAAGLSDDAIQALLTERETARREKQWARADAVRQQLQTAGIILEDSAQGTRWRRG